MTTMAAAVSMEAMRQMLINSFQPQTQEGREELSNLGKVLRVRGFASSKKKKKTLRLNYSGKTALHKPF